MEAFPSSEPEIPEPAPPADSEAAPTDQENLQSRPLAPDLEEIILDLEAPLQKALSQLKENIERGEYSLILGDDAAGRIPALIANKVVRSLYEEKGFSDPLVRFVAGSTDVGNREEKTLKVTEFFAGIKKELLSGQEKEAEAVASPQRSLQNKALIVTDTIESGESVGVLIEALRNNGINADVATVAVLDKSLAYEGKKPNYFWQRQSPADFSLQKRWGAKVASGSEKIPRLYQTAEKYFLGGVAKHPSQIWAKPTKRLFPATASDTQEKINGSRALADEIGSRIYQELFVRPQ